MTIGYPTLSLPRRIESAAAFSARDGMGLVTTAPTSAMGAAFNHSTSRRRTGEDEVGVVVVRGGGLDGLVLRDREVLDDVPADRSGTAAFPKLTNCAVFRKCAFIHCSDAHSACAAMHDSDAQVCPRAWRGVVCRAPQWRAHAAAG
jgi:hypothetical protein